MSKRVVFGNLGNGVDPGLRVSKPGADAVKANEDPADIDDLLFDSLAPIGHLPLWRYYRRYVNAGTRDATTLIVTPGTLTVNYGITLPFAPVVLGYKESNNTLLSLYGRFSTEDPGYTGSRLGDHGFFYTSTATQLTISNYETTGAWFRMFIFYIGV